MSDSDSEGRVDNRNPIVSSDKDEEEDPDLNAKDISITLTIDQSPIKNNEENEYSIEEKISNAPDSLSVPSDPDPVSIETAEDSEDGNLVHNSDEVSRLRAERYELLAINQSKQKQIGALLAAQQANSNKTSAASMESTISGASASGAGIGNGSSSSPGENHAADYHTLLNRLTAVWSQLDHTRLKSESAIDSLTAALDSCDSKTEELTSAYYAFTGEIAKGAVDQYGKSLNMKQYYLLEAEEKKHNEELAEIRLTHLSLQTQLNSFNKSLSNKEELSEGLHFIDFEQLKIENATLNEKIEERNDEIHRLKKKRNGSVEVMTHVREKIWDIYNENIEYMNELNELDNILADQRDELKSLKKQRESIRMVNEKLKIKQGFVGLDQLVQDYEKRKEASKQKKINLDKKKKQYDKLVLEMNKKKSNQNKNNTNNNNNINNNNLSIEETEMGGTESSPKKRAKELVSSPSIALHKRFVGHSREGSTIRPIQQSQQKQKKSIL